MPTGCVTLVGALFGSTIEPLACPSRNGRFGSEFFRVITTVSASGAATDSKLWNRLLSLLVLVGTALRSNENFTAAESNGSPLWNLTPLRSLKV
ncbi:hypothetical protein ABIE80_007552 [Bradyrhizobium diazoefficiens]